jgi:two-component system invasion response regulator UvrY
MPAKRSEPSIKVLVADDHPVIADGLTVALRPFGVEVIGHVGSAAEVMARYRETRPDVLVLDLRFGPGPTGLDVARQLLETHPQARIVFYSQFDEDEIIREAYRLGASAFVTKNTTPDALAQAIKAAHAGRTHFMPNIAERMAMLGVRGDDSPRSKLDEREIEVFTQLAQGLTNNEIAERMGLSTKTISTISQAIKEKLGVHRAAEITRLAMKHGMIEP